jgi:hypothetical protein
MPKGRTSGCRTPKPATGEVSGAARRRATAYREDPPRAGEFIDAGYDHICIHQIGWDQMGFFRFYAQEVLPTLR